MTAPTTSRKPRKQPRDPRPMAREAERRNPEPTAAHAANLAPSTRPAPTIRLFDDCERTDTSPIRPAESFYEFLNRSAVDEPARVRDLCETWFRDYRADVPAPKANSFKGEFQSSDFKQHHGAWFELCIHQFLAALRFDVTVEPNVELSGRALKPDFAFMSNGSRFLVEAAIVKPDSDPRALSPYEDDALRKFAQLEITDYIVGIEETSGTLQRHLRAVEIDREFSRLLKDHCRDPRPTKTIRFDAWVLTVELDFFPGTGINRVMPWPTDIEHPDAVHRAQRKIRAKSKRYRESNDRLILAVNVYSRGFSPLAHGNETLFGKRGIWSPNASQHANPIAAFLFGNADAVNLHLAGGCLFLNPSVAPAALPPAMLRLPHAHGPDGCEYHEGESVASILA